MKPSFKIKEQLHTSQASRRHMEATATDGAQQEVHRLPGSRSKSCGKLAGESPLLGGIWVCRGGDRDGEHCRRDGGYRRRVDVNGAAVAAAAAAAAAAATKQLPRPRDSGKTLGHANSSPFFMPQASTRIGHIFKDRAKSISSSSSQAIVRLSLQFTLLPSPGALMKVNVPPYIFRVN